MLNPHAAAVVHSIKGRGSAWGHADAGRVGLAAAAVAQHPVDPRHLVGHPPPREPGSRSVAAVAADRGGVGRDRRRDRGGETLITSDTTRGPMAGIVPRMPVTHGRMGVPLTLPKELYAKVRELLLRLQGDHTDTEIASVLNVSKVQAQEWLARAITEGWLQKRGSPARYSVIQDKQPDLFNS